MKTGIIVYSFTGNTLKSANKLLDAMTKIGQQAELVQIKAGNEKPQMNAAQVTLNYAPSVDGFDRLVFASPVWGFSLCAVMRAYLNSLPTLMGKKVSLLVTYALPLPFLGANRALRQLTGLCKEKGGEVGKSCSVSWSKKRHQSDLTNMVETLT